MRIWYVFINVFSMYCKLQISLHANTYYNTCHNTYTNTERWYWYVFNTYQHVLVCILACILPVSCICCSDTYQYGLEYVTRYWLRYIPIRSTLHANTDHYAPIQTTTCQYRPLRANTDHYVPITPSSTCSVHARPRRHRSTNRRFRLAVQCTPPYIESEQLIVVRVAVKCARRRSNERPVLVMPS